jgi:O-antigen/teichoic acid export membrane protein
MPVIVLERLGPQANAYFYLTWTIAYSLYLVSVNMGQSLTAESVADPASLESYSYRTLIQTARLLLPAVGLVVLAAPLILHLFGPVYAAQGTPLLRLLALSTLPNMITALYLSILRVKRKVRAILFITGSLCMLALGLGYWQLGVRVSPVWVGLG